MDITPRLAPGLQVIQGFGGGRIRIGAQVFTAPILVFPDEILPWPAAAAGLDEAAFAPLLARTGGLDVAVLGTGRQAGLDTVNLCRALGNRGLNISAMETGAACRTYNVLLTEGRRVAAALIPY